MPSVDAREFLRRMLEEPETITLQERIDYLEHCYIVDSLSSESRSQLAKQIENLKAIQKKEGSRREWSGEG